MIERGYRLVTFDNGNGEPAAGMLVGHMVHELADLTGTSRQPASVLEVLRHWDELHPQLDLAAANADASRGQPLESVKLLAPIQYPGAFFCAGANYWDHLAEMAEIAKQTTGRSPAMKKGTEPWFFIKTSAGSIIGTDAPVRLPKFSKQVDWEAELGVVIASKIRNIDEARAMEAVAGYVIVNDLSARDLMKREGTPFIYDWIGQKCFDDAAPMGPWFTPAAYIEDPENLSIKLWVNDVLKQDSNTSLLVHNISEQVAYLSRHVTLHPGDVIATGTPAGVGMPRGEFLKPGDEVKIEIAGCGVLSNTMTADSA